MQRSAAPTNETAAAGNGERDGPNPGASPVVVEAKEVGPPKSGTGPFVIDDDKCEEEGAFENDDAAAAGSALPPPPSGGDGGAVRTVDDYLEEAWDASSAAGRRRYCLIFVALGIGNMGDGTELSSIGYLLANKEFQDDVLGGDFEVDGSLLAAVALTGMIIGGMVAGAFEDALSRKRTLLCGLRLNAAACVLTSLAPDINSLIALRFFVGLGVGAILSSLTALSAELSPPSHRGLFVTAVSGFWSFGMIFSAMAAYGIMGFAGLGWRAFLLATAAPSTASALLVSRAVPDSPRHLALHGRPGEAAREANVLAATLGHGGDRLTEGEVLRHFPAKAAVVDVGSTEAFYEAGRNVASLYSGHLWNVTVSLQLLWIFMEIGTGLGSFINVICEDIGAGPYIGSALTALGSLTGSILSAIYLDRVGRKPTISVSTVLASLAMICAAWVVSGDTHPLPPLLLSIFLFANLTSFAWNATMCLTSEMFPTKVRATGLGYVAATGRLANVGQQFINGALVERPGVLLSVAAALIATSASTMLLLRTRDMARRPLSDAVGDAGGQREYAMVSLDKEGRGDLGDAEGAEDLPAIV